MTIKNNLVEKMLTLFLLFSIPPKSFCMNGIESKFFLTENEVSHFKMLFSEEFNSTNSNPNNNSKIFVLDYSYLDFFDWENSDSDSIINLLDYTN